MMPEDSLFNDQDHRMMGMALDLAKQGVYTSTPNPRVGSVIVKNGKVVGQGWHEKAGLPHAEILALKEAGEQSQNSTVYVTLEPCSQSGRTGPCTEALIKAGVKEVIYAVEDPNPEMLGKSRNILESSGISVKGGLLSEEAMSLNKGFFKRMQKGLPVIRAKIATSLDGRTAMDSGESYWITGKDSRKVVQDMRAQSCVILTGIGTVLQDNPRLNVREDEVGFPVMRQPAVAVLDSHLRIPLASKIVESAKSRKVIVFYGESEKSVVDFSKKAELENAGVVLQKVDFASDQQGLEKGLDLKSVITVLAELEYNEVMLEAGATLLGRVLQEGWIDKLELFVAPKILGSKARPLADINFKMLSDAMTFVCEGCQSIGEDQWYTLLPKQII